MAFDGRDTAHRHISGEVAHASWNDLNKFHNRLLVGDDNTLSITDSYGNIAVYGLPETLKKCGFTEDQFMENEYDGKLKTERPGYRSIMKVVVPNR